MHPLAVVHCIHTGLDITLPEQSMVIQRREEPILGIAAEVLSCIWNTGDLQEEQSPQYEH